MIRTARFAIPVLVLLATACMSKAAREPLAGGSAAVSEATRSAPAAANGAPVAVPPQGVLVKRGSISLIVTDAAAAEEKIRVLLNELGGYVAGRQSYASVPQQKYLAPSDVRSLTLTLKIDAKKFDDFLAKVKAVGSYTSEEVSIEDVTFAFMDLNARIQNQKRVEERLLGYLNDPARDFKAVIEVEKELGHVREQIEQLSAQLRLMDNQIAYSTLTVNLSVSPEWTAPQERTFWGDLKDTVTASVRSLADTAVSLFILLVAALPWLACGGVLAWLVVRAARLVRRFRKKG